VTAMGLFYFREKLTHLKLAGLVFAFIAIILLSYEE
jgi:multidrug transporter EmrE-like cation transporter